DWPADGGDRPAGELPHRLLEVVEPGDEHQQVDRALALAAANAAVEDIFTWANREPIAAPAAARTGADEFRALLFEFEAEAVRERDHVGVARLVDQLVVEAGGGGHDAPHFSRMPLSEACSALFTVSQRCHATGSISSSISR